MFHPIAVQAKCNTHMIHKTFKTQSDIKIRHEMKTTHIPEEKHTIYTPITKFCRLHTHIQALGVLSLMAARSDSEHLTSPANTVHPVCMWVRLQREQQMFITNMIYNQRIWLSIPTMRSVWIKNTFLGVLTPHSSSSSCSSSIICNQNFTSYS